MVPQRADLAPADDGEALRANKSATFDCVKFRLEGALERSDGYAPECLPTALSSTPEGPVLPASAASVVAAVKVASAEFTASPKRLQFLGKTQAADPGGN